jgi:hypothetical protein
LLILVIFMKKILFSLMLLMTLMSAQAVSAATLKWTSLASGAVNTNDNASTITASYGFGTSSGSFTHDYNFSATPASNVTGLVIELLHENFTISSITLDNIAMTFNSALQRWVGTGKFVTNHALHIAGSTSTSAQQYLLNISTNDATSPVPVPAAIWLFGSALIGLTGLLRRKTAAAV